MMHFLRFFLRYLGFFGHRKWSRHRITCIMRARRTAILNPTKTVRYDFIPAARGTDDSGDASRVFGKTNSNSGA